jgi:hypothetical protein
MKGLTLTSTSQNPPVYQNVFETAQGGFRLDVSVLPAGNVVLAGTPIAYNEATRIANVVKTAIVQANAGSSATVIQIKKGHHFKVGDNIAKSVGGAAYAITAIDTSNAAYDAITIATTLGVALTADTDVLFQSSGNGAAAAVYSQSARGVVYQDVDVVTGADVAVVIRGTLYERRAPGSTAAIKALIPSIIYSQSF